MFSPLARGVGPWFGNESGDQTKNRQVKKATPFLPNLVPETRHRHGVTVTPRAKSVGSVRSSRTEKPDGELVLPKTYITRKGALVLFVADEEILALQERKHLYMRAAKKLIKQKDVDYLDSIGSIPRFAQSVLTLGDEDYERENTSITDSRNQIHLKFLHSFGDRAVDLRAQPGGHVSTYLRDLQSRASTAISGPPLSATTGAVTTTPSSEQDLQSATLNDDESDAGAEGRKFTRPCSAPSPSDRFGSLERQRSHEVLSTERLTASLKSANYLGSRDSPKYRTIGDFKCYYDYEYRPTPPRSNASSPARSQVISPEVRSVTASPHSLQGQGEDDVLPLDSAREDADHVTSPAREVGQAGQEQEDEIPQEDLLLQDEVNERLSISPSVLEEQDIILEKDLPEVVAEEKEDQGDTDLARPDDEAAIVVQADSRPQSHQVEDQHDDEALVETAIDGGHAGSGYDVIADDDAPPGEPSMPLDKGDLSVEDVVAVQDDTDLNRIDNDDVIIEDLPVANDNEVHSLLASPVGSVHGVTPDQDKLHLAEDYVEEVLKYDKAEEERSRTSSVSAGDLEPQTELPMSPQELRTEVAEAKPEDAIEVTQPEVEDVDKTLDDDLQTAEPEIESSDLQAIELRAADQRLDDQIKTIEDQPEKSAADVQGIHRAGEESVVPVEPEAVIQEPVTSPPEVAQKALPDDAIKIDKSEEKDKEDKAKKEKKVKETKPPAKKKITSKSPQREPKSDAGAEQSKKNEPKKVESVPKDKVKKPEKSKPKETPVRKSLKVDMPKEYVQALDITNVDSTADEQKLKPKPTADKKEKKVTSSAPKEAVKKDPTPVRKAPEKKKEPPPVKKELAADIKTKLKLPSVLRSPSPPPKKTKEEEAAEKLEKEVKNLLTSDRTLLEEEGGLSLEELELEQLILMEKLQTAEAKLKDKPIKDGKTRKDQGVKKKGGKKSKPQEETKNLEAEREALREARRLEKEKRLAEAEELQRKIREKDEDRRKQMVEEERTREEMEADIVRAQREADEALLAEEEARSLLATARKEAKEERERRRKEDLERKKQDAQKRRLENKKIAEAARRRELEMRMSIADAEQRAVMELEERLRREEEERLEQERLEEEERLERLRMEEEEKKLAEMERLIDDEAMERLIREREEAEERRRAMQLAARARAEEEELRRQEMEVESLRLEELRRQQEEAENARREEERRRLMELQRQEEEAREQMRQEMDRRKQAALRRREQNLDRCNHSEGLKQNQELTRPWVFSYYVHWPRETYEKLMGEDPKKKKGFGKSRPKTARS